MLHLLVYVRFVGSTTIEEEMLFCRPLETTTKAEDVLELVEAYFHEKDMKWERLVGVCTDGAPAMLGCRSGFIARIKEKNPDVVGTYCVIHREALASKTLPAAMKNKLAIITRIVNFIKISAVNFRLFAKLCKDMNSNHINLLFHTNVRWLSKGNMLARVYDLKDEASIFFKSQGQQDLLLPFQSEEFNKQWHALLTFSKLLIASIYFCKPQIYRMNHYNAIHAFIEKLELWYRRVQKEIAASFPTLDTALEKSKAKLEGKFKAEVESHLQILKEEYDRYFTDLGNVELVDWKMTRNSFRINEDIRSNNQQEEFLEMKCNSTSKDDFEAMSLNNF